MILNDLYFIPAECWYFHFTNGADRIVIIRYNSFRHSNINWFNNNNFIIIGAKKNRYKVVIQIYLLIKINFDYEKYSFVSFDGEME